MIPTLKRRNLGYSTDPNVQRALKRVDSGYAYSQATLNRLHTAGINTDKLLAGLPSTTRQSSEQASSPQSRLQKLETTRQSDYLRERQRLAQKVKANRARRPVRTQGYGPGVPR